MTKPWWSYKKQAEARRLHADAHDSRAAAGSTLGHRVSYTEHQASVPDLEDFTRAALKLAKHNQKSGHGPSALGRVQDCVAELVRRLHVADSQIHHLTLQVHEVTEENRKLEEFLDEKGHIWHFDVDSGEAGEAAAGAADSRSDGP